MSFQPHFIAKTEHVDAPLPRSFRVLSLREFAEDLEEGSLLCPVRAINIYLRRTSSVVVRASSLFVSPRSPSRPISKNAVLYFLREVIPEAGAVRQDVAAPLRAHSVRGVTTSVSFCGTGRSPRCWRPQLGDRTQCSLLCNHTFPEYLNITLSHPRRIYRYVYIPRKRKLPPNGPSYYHW